MISATGCGLFEDDPDPAQPAITPALQLESELNLLATSVNTGLTIEYGYEFEPLVEGTIKSFIVNMPAGDTYRVTLWDSEKQEMLISLNIDASRDVTTNSQEINYRVYPNRNYTVSVYTEHWKRYNYQNNETFFPRIIGDIRMVRYAENTNAASSSIDLMLFPNEYSNSIMQGIVDIEFIPQN
ncbi:hypothetical protein DCC35_19920 [Mangrovivirga cuniculi]|uniref:DUF4082 domain-containing protein n=2 Tax=Mangrovivirga cuniculi TaxID=2715131 RepID=A0A4D7JTH9_9BACT|nr:hypothetical protein DCC35_19920 [Mangrovivirga cuniculi]